MPTIRIPNKSASGGVAASGTPAARGAGVVDTPPAWGSINPVYTEGVAYTYPLPVTDAQGHAITITAINPLPSGFTIVGVGLRYDGTVAAGNIANFRLRATANGLSTDSVAFSANIQAPPVASGFFTGWQPIQRIAALNSGDNNNGISYAGKQARFIGMPDGRYFFIGGDNLNSGEQRIWSLNPSIWRNTAVPNGWKLEHPYWPADGNVYPVHHDCSSVTWDSKRRVFWQVGGFNYGNGSDAPANKIPVVERVMEFNPFKAQGTQWRNTGVIYQQQGLGARGSERVGGAFYDPVLDYVFHGGTAGSYIHAFDPATPGNEKFAFKARVDQPELELAQDGEMLHCLAIDVLNRWLWVMWSDMFNNPTRYIFRFTLPNTRAGLPSDNSTINWTSRGSLVWYNSPTGGLTLSGGSTVVMDGQVRKWYSWLQGPKGALLGDPPAGWGNNFQYGQCGRPESPMLNGDYGSANTGVLVDLITGAVELTQVPHAQYTDGLGWNIPTFTFYDSNTSHLVYGLVNESGYPIGDGFGGQKTVSYALRRKPVPAWLSNLPLFTWHEFPNSNFHVAASNVSDASGARAVRSKWAGAENASASLGGNGRGCLLGLSGTDVWQFSSVSLRRKDSQLLFHGGGGAGASNGNGIISFTLNAETPFWSLPLPPTPASLCIQVPGDSGNFEFNKALSSGPDSVFNGQKTPVAVHAYTSCHFFNNLDLWVRFGSQMVWPSDGGYFNGVHAFSWLETSKDIDSRLWTLNYAPDMPAAGIYPDRSYVKSPWTEQVVGGCDGAWHLYNPESNSWTPNIASGDVGSFAGYSYRPLAIEPVSNVCVFGESGSLASPKLIELDTFTKRTSGSWTGPAVTSGRFNGSDVSLAWDDDNLCFWALKARATTDATFNLFKITLVDKVTCTLFVEEIAVAGSSRPSFENMATSINKFKWVPELGGLVLSTGYNAPIFFVKTSEKA